MVKTATLQDSLTVHSWNQDGSQIAISDNSSRVLIYETKKSEDFTKWELKHTLTEHSGFVSAIDWCHATNKIVTSGHDRNAYVWTFNDGVWNPELVILRINRAATDVKWSPNGLKFAVASGAKCVPVCTYDEGSNWWISKTVRKHKSTVLSVAWSPNSKFIVTGCSDNKARVASAFIKGLDSKDEDGFGEIFPENTYKFGEILAEYDDARAWVNSVAWSPNGFRIAFAGHGSTVHFVQLLAGAAPSVSTVHHNGLPFMKIDFLSDNALVGVGWDCNPAIFGAAGSDADPKWEFKQLLDKAEKKSTAAASSKFAAAQKLFVDSTKKGISKDADETVLDTLHQNTIIDVVPYSGSAGTVTTTSLDGTIRFWNLAKAGVDTAALKIA